MKTKLTIILAILFIFQTAMAQTTKEADPADVEDVVAGREPPEIVRASRIGDRKT